MNFKTLQVQWVLTCEPWSFIARSFNQYVQQALSASGEPPCGWHGSRCLPFSMPADTNGLLPWPGRRRHLCYPKTYINKMLIRGRGLNLKFWLLFSCTFVQGSMLPRHKCWFLALNYIFHVFLRAILPPVTELVASQRWQDGFMSQEQLVA